MATLYLGNKIIQDSFFLHKTDPNALYIFSANWNITKNNPIKVDLGINTNIRFIEKAIRDFQFSNIYYKIIIPQNKAEIYMRNMAEDIKQENKIDLQDTSFQSLLSTCEYLQELFLLLKFSQGELLEINTKDINDTIISKCISHFNSYNIEYVLLPTRSKIYLNC